MSSIDSDLMPSKPTKGNAGYSWILYGDNGTGKTSTLDDENMKVLVLDLEGGESVLEGSPNVDIVHIKNMEQLNKYAGWLNDGKWLAPSGKLEPIIHGLVAVDSITRLADLVKDYVVRVVAPNRKREVVDINLSPLQRFGSQSDWGNFGTIMADLVKFFHNMTKKGEKSINVCFIAHKDNKYEDPTAETRVTGTQIKMQGGSVPIVMSVVDAYFYMDKVEKKDEKTKETKVHYFIRTDKAGIVDVKVRQSKRDERLPKVIENPVWSDILTKLGYKITPPATK